MLAERIDTFIFAVHIDLNTHHARCPFETANPGYFHCRNISQQGFVGIICEQSPFFVRRHPKDGGFAFKFHLVWFLWHAPCGIAAPAYLHRGTEDFRGSVDTLGISYLYLS